MKKKSDLPMINYQDATLLVIVCLKVMHKAKWSDYT